MFFMKSLLKYISKFYSKNKKAAQFLIRVIIIYAGWKLLSHLLGEEHIPIEDRIWPWLSQGWESFNDYFRLILLNTTKSWFDWRGLDSEIINNYRLWVHGYANLGVGNYCLAIQLWIFFVALIVSYSGKWYNKLWFSLLGVLLINMINVLRLIIIVYAAHHNPESIQFNHDYVFNVAIYIFTFFMWIIWVNKFSDNPKQIQNHE